MPSIALPVSLRGQLLSGTRTFSPASLFSANEPGVWFDPSDLTTLFTDPAGTTPVTTPGQTVGLMLDKSKGLVLGAELWADQTPTIVNFNGTSGTYDDSTNTMGNAVAGGTSSWPRYAFNLGLVAGVSYYVDIQVSSVSALAGWFVYGESARFLTQTAGRFRGYIIGPSSGGTLTFQSNLGTSAGWAVIIDNISVRELAGNHATQATLAARPTYSIEPVGGRRNLLLQTEAFNEAVWVKTGSTVATNAASAPDATLTADRLTETSAAGEHFTFQQLAKAGASITYTQSCYFKADAGSRNFGLGITDGTTGGYAAIFSTSGSVVASSQVVGSVSGWTFISSSVVSAGDGWMRASITATTNTATRVDGVCYLADGSLRSYIGNGTSSLFIWGAQLELGSTASPYQRVTTAFDVTEAGVASLSYLYFDGVNDAMATSTITPGIDKAQVFAGVRKLSDANVGVVAELSASLGANNGTLMLLAPLTGGASGDFVFRSKGTALSGAASISLAPASKVVTGLGDIGGDLATLRLDGTQVAQTTTDQGTGNYLAYPLYLGAREGSYLLFTGHLYSLITRFGPTLDAPTITSTEIWVGDKTGIDIAKNISTTIYTRSGDTILDRANSTIERRA